MTTPVLDPSVRWPAKGGLLRLAAIASLGAGADPRRRRSARTRANARRVAHLPRDRGAAARTGARSPWSAATAGSCSLGAVINAAARRVAGPWPRPAASPSSTASRPPSRCSSPTAPPPPSRRSPRCAAVGRPRVDHRGVVRALPARGRARPSASSPSTHRRDEHHREPQPRATARATATPARHAGRSRPRGRRLGHGHAATDDDPRATPTASARRTPARRREALRPDEADRPVGHTGRHRRAAGPRREHRSRSPSPTCPAGPTPPRRRPTGSAASATASPATSTTSTGRT